MIRLVKIWTVLITLVLCTSSMYGQVKVIHFNADWNTANSVKWIKDLNDCKISSIDIVDNTKMKDKHKIVIVPTIVVFKDGEEVKRFQADLSFTIQATRKEIQNYIDELIISKF